MFRYKIPTGNLFVETTLYPPSLLLCAAQLKPGHLVLFVEDVQLHKDTDILVKTGSRCYVTALGLPSYGNAPHVSCGP